MPETAATFRRLYATFGALITLLVATAAASTLPPGWWSTPVSLLIATAKAALIFTIFMRLRYQPALVRIFSLVGFFWLAIMLTLTASDYFTRFWPP
jgi:cytochrome c oxidase subunit 4